MLNFKNNKRILSLIILVFSFALSVFIALKDYKNENVSATKNDNNFTVISKTNQKEKTNKTLEFESVPFKNLTLKFADNIGKDALQNNFYQDTKNNPSFIPNNKDAYIAQKISDLFEEDLKIPLVEKSDIKVGADNSTGTQMLYLLYLDSVISNIPSFGSENQDKDFEISEVFASAAEKFESAINLLKIVYVPPSWVKVHYKILTLLTYQRNIFISLSKGSDDPLRFMLSLKQIQKNEFEEGLKIIRKEIEQKLKDEKLI